MAVESKKVISKMAAVKKALKELGKDAMPVKIQEFVKTAFGLEMSTAHVSNYKTHIQRSKKAKRAAKAAAAVPVPGASSPAKPHNGTAVSIQDLEAVKGLVGRVGEENLKSLIGLLKS